MRYRSVVTSVCALGLFGCGPAPSGNAGGIEEGTVEEGTVIVPENPGELNDLVVGFEAQVVRADEPEEISLLAESSWDLPDRVLGVGTWIAWQLQSGVVERVDLLSDETRTVDALESADEVKGASGYLFGMVGSRLVRLSTFSGMVDDTLTDGDVFGVGPGWVVWTSEGDLVRAPIYGDLDEPETIGSVKPDQLCVAGDNVWLRLHTDKPYSGEPAGIFLATPGEEIRLASGTESFGRPVPSMCDERGVLWSQWQSAEIHESDGESEPRLVTEGLRHAVLDGDRLWGVSTKSGNIVRVNRDTGAVKPMWEPSMNVEGVSLRGDDIVWHESQTTCLEEYFDGKSGGCLEYEYKARIVRVSK